MTTKPHYLEWDAIGLCGLTGESGSGKTSTLRFILAQFAMAGTGIILIDGHGRMANAGQTLAQSCIPLQKAFIVPVAVKDTEIMRSVTLARTIAENRLHGKDTNTYRVVLVIDEVVSILSRLSQEDSTFIVDTLLRFATEYRKTEVKGFITAHNWSKDFIGSAALRRSMNAFIMHRLHAEKVKQFTRDPLINKSTPILKIGHAWVLQQTQDPVRVIVPQITLDDLQGVSQYVIPFETTRNTDESFATVSSTVSPLQSGVSQVSSDAKTLKNMQKWYDEITKLAAQGYNKTDSIKHIWNVSPGSTKKYKIASRMYDYLRSYDIQT